jgi:tRNA A-37 threonylcarbamoyl transferase component Bud32
VPLDVFIRDRLPQLPGGTRRELLQRLAEYVRRLHGHRFEHHDLYWRNIILQDGGLARFFLIDAHKGRQCSVATELAGRAQDLATLDAAAPRYFRRTERLGFLLRYLGRKKLLEEDKPFVRRILAVAGPMRQRQLNRLGRAGE